MARTYTVQDGDSMALIARKFGLRDWRLLYRHPDNAAFRRACPDPNLLVVGTELHVPDTPAPTRYRRQTGAEYEFVLGRSVDVLRVRVTSPGGEVLDGWEYRLTVGDDQVRGTLPDGGRLEVEIAEPVHTATLKVWPPATPEPDKREEIELRIGGLGPADEPRSLQARLANLGLYHDEPDGDLESEATVSALRIAGHGVLDVVSKYGC